MTIIGTILSIGVIEDEHTTTLAQKKWGDALKERDLSSECRQFVAVSDEHALELAKKEVWNRFGLSITNLNLKAENVYFVLRLSRVDLNGYFWGDSGEFAYSYNLASLKKF